MWPFALSALIRLFLRAVIGLYDQSSTLSLQHFCSLPQFSNSNSNPETRVRIHQHSIIKLKLEKLVVIWTSNFITIKRGDKWQDYNKKNNESLRMHKDRYREISTVINDVLSYIQSAIISYNCKWSIWTLTISGTLKDTRVVLKLSRN